MSYRLLPKAETDLEEIWLYSAGQWGVAQADNYYREIIDTFSRLAGAPLLARPCPAIRRGFFRYTVGSHVIFFRRKGDAIEIVRILYQRMDFGRRL